MIYYYSIPDTKNTYEPQTAAQRNYLARKAAKTEAVKKAIRLGPDLRDIVYSLEERSYRGFLEVGKLEDKKVPYYDTHFGDSEISRKELDDYINFIYQGRI